MDIFQAFLSRDNENSPTFSEIFHSAAALKCALGTKSYLLDHYLSLFFRLTAQIDFVALQDEVYQSMADAQRSFKENPSLLSEFHCQEPATKINLCFLRQADSILEQARKDFLREKTFEWNAAVDLMELQQTEQKLMEHMGKEPLEAFQRMLLRRFLPCPLAPLFSQGILVEMTKRFLSRDLETDQEVFRLFLKTFRHEKSD
ncbi:hypothetical protein [Anaerotignum lactatifermentans]|uniref:hypothetical protein n=1 Tax=Anaerotignum lactatifermentans TaxID=160404 RepID=UPI002677613A|nr:hypothetical protein [Anaerotignum lactatifermentans]